MAIISFDKDALIDYIPEYCGNRGSEHPCIVRLKFVPYSRVQHYTRIAAGRTKGVSDPSKMAEIAQEIQKKQFVENVDSVSGYFVGEREVTEPGEFYETAETSLISEILKAMESTAKLTDGQRKN